MITRGIVRNIGAVEGPIYTILGSNPYGVAIFLHNIGLNSIVYKFQKSIDGLDVSYQDVVVDVDGYSAVSGTIAADGVKSLLLTATTPYLRIVASANGGSVLNSHIVQFNKSTSDILPILAI